MLNESLNVGSYVVYDSSGVCRLNEIKSICFAGENKEREYYVFAPVNTASTIFVPTDNDQLKEKIRDVLSEREIGDMLQNARGNEMNWIDDRRTRSEEFNETLSRGIDTDLFLMMRCIYRKKTELEKQKKHLSSMDDELLKNAERLIRDEFAFALKIDEDQVDDYIFNALEA